MGTAIAPAASTAMNTCGFRGLKEWAQATQLQLYMPVLSSTDS